MNESYRPARSVVLDGRRVSYTIQKSRTGRKCRIRVSLAGVVVLLPRGTGEERAASFLQESARWVLEQLAAAERLGKVRAAESTPPGDTILLRGERRQVEVIEETTQRRYALVDQQGETIRVRVPRGRPVDTSKAVEAWLRRQARQDILVRLRERSVQMKVQPGRLYVMAQRTKWGNCSRLRNLSFNWRLIMAPPAVLDYIVVHELSHLIEPSHSTRFWFVVRSYCSEYERYRRWLRENQERLGMHC